MWLYQAQGLFMICALDTDVTTNNQRLFISSGPHTHTKREDSGRKSGPKY